MPHVFHPAAEAEHVAQVAFYEARRRGLGARYLAEVETTLAQIEEGPARYSIERAPDIRRAGVRRFPFNVIYRQRSQRLEILAIQHHRRRPDYWHLRLKARG